MPFIDTTNPTPRSLEAAPQRPRYRFGFDIGGTFTDFVLIDGATGAVRTHKVLTTPEAPSRAVMEGWRTLLAEVGAEGADVASAIHATPVGREELLGRVF